MEYTRQDYLDKKCNHKEYYAQFVTKNIINIVKNSIGIDRILASKDEYLNDIPLRLWDNLPFDHSPLSIKVCVGKEAARQIKEVYS